MNKIYVGETHGVRRQFKLAVRLAETHSAFVNVWLRNGRSAAQVPGELVSRANCCAWLARFCIRRGTTCGVPGGFGPPLFSF